VSNMRRERVSIQNRASLVFRGCWIGHFRSIPPNSASTLHWRGKLENQRPPTAVEPPPPEVGGTGGGEAGFPCTNRELRK